MSKSENNIYKNEIMIDGLPYQTRVYQQTFQPIQAPRIVVVAYQPNQSAQELLKICIQTIQRYTPEPHELWIVDNHSPTACSEWLLHLPYINLILNDTEPIPPKKRTFWRKWKMFQKQQQWGSYANAIGLELATHLVDPQTRYLLTMHMDTMVCRSGWLTYLQSKINEKVRISGVHLEKGRVPEGVVHILGNFIDFQLLKQLKINFLPQLPQLDVGDQVTIKIREAGYSIFSCRNTYNELDLISIIPPFSPFKYIRVFRAFDDDNQVFFLHLGRGVRKTTGEHHRGVQIAEWIEFANQYLLNL